MELTPAAIQLLIEALDATNTAFILGAGASAPEVPVMRELIQRVLVRFKQEVKGFILTGDEPTPTHYLLADQAADEETREALLTANIATLRLLIARELQPAPSMFRQPPVQYRVLSRITPAATVINYNVDRLASTHCRAATVIPIHGDVPDFVGRIPLRSAVRLTQDGVQILSPESYWLPEPETEPALLDRIDPAYRALLNVATIVIIGYSFGIGTGVVMDGVSYGALTEYCRGRQVRILVVDPQPRELAGRLAEELLNSMVVPLPVRWNRLCEAILRTEHDKGVGSLLELQQWAREILQCYEGFLE